MLLLDPLLFGLDFGTGVKLVLSRISSSFLLVDLPDDIIGIVDWCAFRFPGPALLLLGFSSAHRVIVLRNGNLFELLHAHDLTCFATLKF